MAQRMNEGSRDGFTLIEVIVSIIILSVSFALIMQLFSGGLRSSRLSCDYTRAIVHANDKMDELYDKPVNDSGEFDDGFRWVSEIMSHKEHEDSGYNLKKIKLKILWPDISAREHYFEIVSLKAAVNEELM